jgi:hypothetical protein
MNKLVKFAPTVLKAIVWLIVWLYTPVCWTVNLLKLLIILSDDAAKNEHIVIHCIGLIPPVSWVTAWV